MSCGGCRPGWTGCGRHTPAWLRLPGAGQLTKELPLSPAYFGEDGIFRHDRLRFRDFVDALEDSLEEVLFSRWATMQGGLAEVTWTLSPGFLLGKIGSLRIPGATKCKALSQCLAHRKCSL